MAPRPSPMRRPTAAVALDCRSRLVLAAVALVLADVTLLLADVAVGAPRGARVRLESPSGSSNAAGKRRADEQGFGLAFGQLPEHVAKHFKRGFEALEQSSRAVQELEDLRQKLSESEAVRAELVRKLRESEAVRAKLGTECTELQQKRDEAVADERDVRVLLQTRLDELQTERVERGKDAILLKAATRLATDAVERLCTSNEQWRGKPKPLTEKSGCAVCLTAEAEWACVPCGHLIFCGTCKDNSAVFEGEMPALQPRAPGPGDHGLLKIHSSMSSTPRTVMRARCACV